MITPTHAQRSIYTLDAMVGGNGKGGGGGGVEDILTDRATERERVRERASANDSLRAMGKRLDFSLPDNRSGSAQDRQKRGRRRRDNSAFSGPPDTLGVEKMTPCCKFYGFWSRAHHLSLGFRYAPHCPLSCP